MKKLNILIADDHAIVRMGLASIFGTQKDMAVVGMAEDGEEAVREAERLKPDVVVMDLMMPKTDGAAATAAIKAALPETEVLLLTTFGASDGIGRALANGAKGAILKSTPNVELIKAVRSVAAGTLTVAPDIKRLMREEPPVAELTPRQHEILEAMARGLTNAEIARTLDICEPRVKEHVNAILTKLGAYNRTEAVAIAYRKNLVGL